MGMNLVCLELFSCFQLYIYQHYFGNHCCTVYIQLPSVSASFKTIAIGNVELIIREGSQIKYIFSCLFRAALSGYQGCPVLDVCRYQIYWLFQFIFFFWQQYEVSLDEYMPCSCNCRFSVSVVSDIDEEPRKTTFHPLIEDIILFKM